MKTNNKYFAIILFSFFLLCNFGFSQQPDQHNFAQQYVDAYINLQFNDLSSYYNDESTFQDPTLALIYKEAAQKVVGKAAILEKLKRNFHGVSNPVYQLKTHYTVGDYSIFTGIYDYDQNATAFGGPDIDIHFSLKSTTIIKEKSGSILEHIEYMDYTSWFQQFETQKNGRE